MLALASGSVRLIEVLRDGPPFTVSVPGLPKDAASAARKASITDRSPSGRVQGSEGQKLRLRQYARKVEQALRSVVAGLELPLILAATEPLDVDLPSGQHLPRPRRAGHPAQPRQRHRRGARGRGARGARRRLRERARRGARRCSSSGPPRGGPPPTSPRSPARRPSGAVDTLLVDIDEKVPGFVDDGGAVTFADDERSATASSTRSPSGCCSPAGACSRCARRTSRPTARRRDPPLPGLGGGRTAPQRRRRYRAISRPDRGTAAERFYCPSAPIRGACALHSEAREEHMHMRAVLPAALAIGLVMAPAALAARVRRMQITSGRRPPAATARRPSFPSAGQDPDRARHEGDRAGRRLGRSGGRTPRPSCLFATCGGTCTRRGAGRCDVVENAPRRRRPMTGRGAPASRRAPARRMSVPRRPPCRS